MWSAATKIKPETATSDRPKSILFFSFCFKLKGYKCIYGLFRFGFKS
jgi:hypothetical protein